MTVQLLLEKALELHQAGKLEEAEALYAQVLAQNPDDSDALHLLGLIHLKTHRGADAAALLERAVAVEPDVAEFWNALGNARLLQNDTQRAAEAFSRAAALDNEHGESRFNLALAQAKLGKISDAIASLRQAAALMPRNPLVHFQLGEMLERSGATTEAVGHYSRAAYGDPRNPQYRLHLAQALRLTGDITGAVYALRAALELAPESLDVNFRLGSIYRDTGHYAEAERHLTKTIALAPRHRPAYIELGLSYQLDEKPAMALEAHERAYELDPAQVDALSMIGTDYWSMGLAEEAIEAHRRAAAMAPDNPTIVSAMLSALNYSDALPEEIIFQEHAAWGTRCAEARGKSMRPHRNDPNPQRRLRIGFVSPDLRKHPVGWFLEPIVSNLDREQFEIIGYSSSEASDEITERLRRASAEWRQIQRVSDTQAAKQIREDGIDILVDLAGHTAENRLPILAQKPAPLQMTHFGYPNTTGLPTVDYRITDPISEPPGKTEQWSVEKLARLPRCAWCYRVPAPFPEVRERPLKRAGAVMLGTLNNFAKITTQALQTWAKMLQQIENSRLMLLMPSDCLPRVQAFFESQGIPPQRLRLCQRTDREGYLKLHDAIDIYLDPFPYNGGVTSCDALWMGCPMIAIQGRTYRARQGAQLLTNVGVPELIANDPQHSIQIAMALARDVDRVAELRKTLRDRIAASAVMNFKQFAADLGQAYRESWRNWCQHGSRAG